MHRRLLIEKTTLLNNNVQELKLVLKTKDDIIQKEIFLQSKAQKIIASQNEEIKNLNNNQILLKSQVKKQKRKIDLLFGGSVTLSAVVILFIII